MTSKLNFSNSEVCDKFLEGRWENTDSKHTYHIPSCLYKITSKDLSRETGGKRCCYPNITGGECQNPATYSGCLINSKNPVICGTHYKALCVDKGWDYRLSRCINVLCDKHKVSMEDRDKLHRYMYTGNPLKRNYSTNLESSSQKRRKLASVSSDDESIDDRSCDGSSEDSLNDSFIVDDDESISYESENEPLCLDLVDSDDDDSVYSSTDKQSNSFGVDEEPIETETNPTVKEPIETNPASSASTETILIKDYPIKIEKKCDGNTTTFKIICEINKMKNTQFQFEMR